MNQMALVAWAAVALALVVFLAVCARIIARKFSRIGVPLKPGQIVAIGGLYFRVMPLDQTDFTSLDAIYVILAAEPDGRFQVLDAGDSPDRNAPPPDLDKLKATWKRQSSDVWVGVYLLPANRNMKKDHEEILRTLKSLI